MLAQLIYVSNRKSNCTEQEIEKILESCKKNNPPLGITGVLLYNDKVFLQLVEGEYKIIIDTYDKIKNDDRHEKCVMLSCGIIKEKSFSSWNMGLKKIDNTIELLTNISNEEKKYLEYLISGNEEKDGLKALQIIKKIFS